jgi:ATP-dependent DNA helicase RecG
MQSSLEKLRKFFGLEREKGYDNSAIIGGLAQMLDHWEGEARADNIKEDVIEAVRERLRSYGGLSPESRADVLKGLWKRIGEAYPEAARRPDESRQHDTAAARESVVAAGPGTAAGRGRRNNQTRASKPASPQSPG